MSDTSGGDYLGLLGLLGAAALSSAGAIYNNHQQQKLTKSINSMAVDLADSAHQREVLDLYKAGLNPILSATGNGASVPSLGTPRLDNVLSDFGSSARGIGDMLSKQRSLQNQQMHEQVDAAALENEYNRGTVEHEINAAKAEARAREMQAYYDKQVQEDKFDELNKWRYHRLGFNKHGDPVIVKNPKYLKEIRDSVEAEVKEPGTRYLQSWISTGGKAAGDVINGATGLKSLFTKPRPRGRWRY